MLFSIIGYYRYWIYSRILLFIHFIIFFLKFFYWSIVNLQCSASFKHTAKWFSYVHICVCWSLSHVWLFVAPWTVAHQAPLSTEFSRQEYWSGLPFPTPGDFPNPGIEPVSLMSSALASGFFTIGATWEAQTVLQIWCSYVIDDPHWDFRSGQWEKAYE